MRARRRAALAFLLALGWSHAGGQEGKPFPPEQIRKGAALYDATCSTCHGKRLANPEWAPVDLRKFPPADHARFVDTVTHGIRGMPPWGDMLKPEDIEALWAYVMAGER